jgi:hypothetical protein
VRRLVGVQCSKQLKLGPGLWAIEWIPGGVMLGERNFDAGETETISNTSCPYPRKARK